MNADAGVSLLPLLLVPPTCALAFGSALGGGRYLGLPRAPITHRHLIAPLCNPIFRRPFSSARPRMQDFEASDKISAPSSPEKKLAKVHSSTLALIPPDAAWAPLQALRLQLQVSCRCACVCT